jgi:hypothetical protein
MTCLKQKYPSRARAAAAMRRHGILTVSQFVHGYLQSCAVIPVDAKGRETIRVSKIAGFEWNTRIVPPGKQPFRIRKWKAAA